MSSSSSSNAASLPLAHERVALLGKLSSMSRDDAARLVAEHGGVLLPRPDTTTTLLVQGDEASATTELPPEVETVLIDSRVAVIDETQLWRRLGLVDDAVGVSRLYTPALLAQMVGVESRLIRRWHRRGYLVPVCEVRKLPYFDFSELRVVRHLADLAHAGLSPAAIDRQIAQLERMAPEVARPLAEFSIVIDQGKLFLRHGNELAEPSGQLLIDFEATTAPAEPVAPLRLPKADTPPALGELRLTALDLQDEGEPQQALAMIRSVLLSGGAIAEDHFMVADLLYQMGELAAARERYFMAIEIDEGYVEARANLGCVLVELGELELAATAFQGALERHTDFPDGHYHLAQVLDQLGQAEEAITHWQAFLALAPESPWAEEARQRLAEQ